MDSEKEVGPYLLFGGSGYYALGGWVDFKGYFSSSEEAKAWLDKEEPADVFMWAHLVYESKIIAWASGSDSFKSVHPEWEWRDKEW